MAETAKLQHNTATFSNCLQLSQESSVKLRITTSDLVSDEKGYKEKHDLVVVYCANESYNGDEQQEDAHRDDPSNNVNARHQAEPLPPCCYSNQQQPDQL